MSMEAIRPYFRSLMNELGYREWTDAFNYQNIPETILDKSYHILSPSGSRQSPFDPTDLNIIQSTQIRVFFKGFRTPAMAVDECMAAYDKILKTALAPTRRLNAGVIKNVFFDNMRIDAIDASNDNSAVLEITFSCLIIACT